MVGSNYVVVEFLSDLVALTLNIRLRLVYATHVCSLVSKKYLPMRWQMSVRFQKFLKFGVDFLEQIPYTMGVGSPNKLKLS